MIKKCYFAMAASQVLQFMDDPNANQTAILEQLE
jgi:hypothetical protein